MLGLFKLLNLKGWLLKKEDLFFVQQEPDAFQLKGSANDMNDDDSIYLSVLRNLDQEKVFLDSSLSLNKLSSLIGTNTTYLSNTINQRFGCNFKTLINSYRINYCKEILLTQGFSMSVNKLSKQAGFSSISAFYAVFKKMTGRSPARYRDDFCGKTNN